MGSGLVNGCRESAALIDAAPGTDKATQDLAALEAAASAP